MLFQYAFNDETLLQVVGMSHGVPKAALEDDHSHVLNAKSALQKKSKGDNKPKVNVNVEGGSRLVIREGIDKKETEEEEQVC
jgi:hypothetical protein